MFLSFTIVLVLFCISWYTFSYHDDVNDYKSGFSRAYDCYMKTVRGLMFHDESNVFDTLALFSTKTFDVDSYGAKGDGKKDDTKVRTHDYI